MRITFTALAITLSLVFTPKLLANERFLFQTQTILHDLNTARNELGLADSYRERVKALSNLIQETEESLSDLRSAYRTIKLQSKNLNKDIILQKEKIAYSFLSVSFLSTEGKDLEICRAFENASIRLIVKSLGPSVVDLFFE